MTTPLISLIMGSDSDLVHLEGGIAVLEEAGLPFEVRVMSAHRTPERVREFAQGARDRGVKIILAAAGGAAHLAGAVAAATTLPVVGIPIPSSTLDGMDALLATVQMPPGIPVATVGVGNSKNAALLAAEMLALADGDLAKKLKDLRVKQAEQVREKDAKVRAKFEG